MPNILMFLVRHGTTNLNDSGAYRGHIDNAETQLNIDGKIMAAEAGMFLKPLVHLPTKIICSDLGRTTETAEIISAILGGVPIFCNEKLRPLDVGDFAGKDKKENPLTKYIENPKLKIPGGESVNTFQNRQAEVFESILGLVEETGIIPIIICHTSNIVTLWNFYNQDNRVVEDHSDVLKPGGIGIFMADGLIPVHRIDESISPERAAQALEKEWGWK